MSAPLSLRQTIALQQRRDRRFIWWQGFLWGALAMVCAFYLVEPIVTGQWQLL